MLTVMSRVHHIDVNILAIYTLRIYPTLKSVVRAWYLILGLMLSLPFAGNMAKAFVLEKRRWKTDEESTRISLTTTSFMQRKRRKIVRVKKLIIFKLLSNELQNNWLTWRGHVSWRRDFANHCRDNKREDYYFVARYARLSRNSIIY